MTEDFKNVLKELGYPDDDIQFCLNYCQGDGVDFAGTITDPDTTGFPAKLLTRIFPDESPKNLKVWLDTLSRFDVTFRVYRIDSHYHHWNTMRIEYEIGTEYPEQTDSDVQQWCSSNGYTDPFWHLQEDSWYAYPSGGVMPVQIESMEPPVDLFDRIEAAILEDVRQASKKLERIGYETLDGLTEEDYLVRLAEENEYRFTIAGEWWDFDLGNIRYGFQNPKALMFVEDETLAAE